MGRVLQNINLPRSEVVIPDGLPTNGTADAQPAIQAAIERARVGPPGRRTRIFIPNGVYSLRRPIVLPRTGVSPLNVVTLEGESMRGTRLVAAAIVDSAGNAAPGVGEFQPGQAVIEWEPVVARAWHQSITNMTIAAPTVDGTHCIRYRMASTVMNAAAYDLERAQFELVNLVLEGSDEFQPSLILLNGYSIGSVIANVYGDPRTAATFSNRRYVVYTLETDTDIPPGPNVDPSADKPGLFGALVSHIYGGIRRGGSSGVFKGRLASSTFENAIGGIGVTSRVPGPSYAFIQCYNAQISDLFVEARSDSPQVLFERCNFCVCDDIGLGAPSSAFPVWAPNTAYAVGSYVRPTSDAVNRSFVCTAAGVSGAVEPAWPASGSIADGSAEWTFAGVSVGNGIEVIDSRGVYIRGRGSISSKPLFSTYGVRAVVIDSASRDCFVEDFGLNIPGSLANIGNEISVAGAGNHVQGYAPNLDAVYGIGNRTSFATEVANRDATVMRIAQYANQPLALVTAGSTRWLVGSTGSLTPAGAIDKDVGDNTQRVRALWAQALTGNFRAAGGSTLVNDCYATLSDGETVTLLTAVNTRGRLYFVENVGGAPGTIARQAGQTINGAAADFPLAAGELALCVSDGVSDWRVKVIAT